MSNVVTYITVASLVEIMNYFSGGNFDIPNTFDFGNYGLENEFAAVLPDGRFPGFGEIGDPLRDGTSGLNGFDPILEMPGQIFEDEDAVHDTFNEFERNQGNPGKIENFGSSKNIGAQSARQKLT